MGTTNGLNVICTSAEFPLEFLLSALQDGYTINRICALEILCKVADCSHSVYASKLKDPLFTEVIFNYLLVSLGCGCALKVKFKCCRIFHCVIDLIKQLR